eukprot:1186595-Prorocentrum_minimum.AAC.1
MPARIAACLVPPRYELHPSYHAVNGRATHYLRFAPGANHRGKESIFLIGKSFRLKEPDGRHFLIYGTILIARTLHGRYSNRVNIYECPSDPNCQANPTGRPPLERRDGRELGLGYPVVQVTFENEGVIDQGGGFRESVSTIAEELMSDRTSLFVP